MAGGGSHVHCQKHTIPIGIAINIVTPHVQNWLVARALTRTSIRVKVLKKELAQAMSYHNTRHYSTSRPVLLFRTRCTLWSVSKHVKWRSLQSATWWDDDELLLGSKLLLLLTEVRIDLANLISGEPKGDSRALVRKFHCLHGPLPHPTSNRRFVDMEMSGDICDHIQFFALILRLLTIAPIWSPHNVLLSALRAGVYDGMVTHAQRVRCACTKVSFQKDKKDYLPVTSRIR
jgi:hypothetical protein